MVALADVLTRPGRPLLRRHLAGPLQIGGLQARCHALEPDVALGRTLLLGQQGEAIGVNRIDPNAAAFAEKLGQRRISARLASAGGEQS